MTFMKFKGKLVQLPLSFGGRWALVCPTVFKTGVRG